MELASRLEDGADDQGSGVVQTAADTLREQDADIKQLRAAVADILCCLRYIRQAHSDLYGVGLDLAQAKAEKALGIGQGAQVPEAKVLVAVAPPEPSREQVQAGLL